MQITKRIFVGLFAGFLCGIFFGDLCRVLQPAAAAFVKLMQMAVIPYVVVSIIAGIGALEAGEARAVARRGGALMAFLWLAGILIFFSMQFAFPPRTTGAFYSAAVVQRPEAADILGTFIPANPFKALADGVLPAIVLFSVFFGAALIGAGGKRRLIEIFSVGSDALSRVTDFIMALVPYGIFVISAYASGTLSPDALFQLQFFCESYIALSVVLGLVVLPLFLSAVTGFRYREILAASAGAVLLAFSAQKVFVALPLIERGVRGLFGGREGEGGKPGAYAELMLPIAYNFPRWGDFAPYLFILFTGWLYETPLHAGKQLELAAAGLLSFFGSGKSAVPFLLTLMRLPEDAFQIYIASSPLNSYFGAGLSCMFLFAFTAAASARLTGRARVRPWAAARAGVVIAFAMAACIAGLRAGFARMLSGSYRGDEMISAMELPAPPARVRAAPAVTVYRTLDDFRAARGRHDDDDHDVLDRIRERGSLRVGYHEDALPFSFFNAKGDLVGYDVQGAHELAAQLGVARLEFVPVGFNEIAEALDGGRVDIVMDGVVLTPERLGKMKFTESYMSSHLAFVTQDHRREEFSDMRKVAQRDDISIAVMRGTAYDEMLHDLFPRARAVRLSSEREFFDGRRADALLTTAEEGAPWTLLYPAYCVAQLGRDGGIRFLHAYPVAKGADDSFLRFVNGVLEMERACGALDRKYDYWILGKNPLRTRRRWSVIRDILHWVP